MRDDIGDRFKGYEGASRYYHPRRIPLIIRLDGKAFHSLTWGLEKPYSKAFIDIMVDTARQLCEEIQTCKFAYVQSDEISLLLINYEDVNTEPWFGNCKSKIESVSASLTARAFHLAVSKVIATENLEIYDMSFKMSRASCGVFDSRSFILPAHEVCNYFIWRQQDAIRNAISGAAQSMFSHLELQGLSSDQMQEKMFTEKGVNFNDYPTYFKRGVSVYKVARQKEITIPNKGAAVVERNVWEPDHDIPIFTQDRKFIERVIPEYIG